MTLLFESGELRQFLAGLLADVSGRVEKLSEDELLSRSIDDMVEEFCSQAVLHPLMVGNEAVDGTVSETTVDVSNDFRWNGGKARGMRVTGTFELSGDVRLLKYRPSTFTMTRFEAAVGAGRITVESVRPGVDQKPEQIKADLQGQIEKIRKMAEYANADVQTHNQGVEATVRRLVEQRQERVRKRRDLAGALGFPLTRRQNAPQPVPLERKRIGTARQHQRLTSPYKDEPALTDAQYEDAIAVVKSTLLAMERTPSVASGKSEEELRDQILVQLNGTFTGGATGETFVQKGKTDILVKVDERHVFVGECKWWSGSKACSEAVDQLLGYMPWRNEKAALILFINRKDATAVIRKADEALRAHAAFKRVGAKTSQSGARLNYVLGHPDDPDREIQLAALFAVLPKDGHA